MQISDRMKSYETDQRLESGAVIIRVDGKNFHTWTKKIGAEKPFDEMVMESMVVASARTARQMQGFKLAYTQSDEATFLLMNTERESGWFDYKVQKLASVTASYFTHFFNEHFDLSVPAFFDARAFNIPIDDAANNFVWRQQDWRRNSIQMLGQAHFSHKDMQGLSNNQVLDLLRTAGIEWDALSMQKKYGAFIVDTEFGFTLFSEYWDYNRINEMVGIDVYADN